MRCNKWMIVFIVVSRRGFLVKIDSPAPLRILLAGVLAVPALAGCGGGGEEEGSGDATLTVWSLENQTDRVQATQAIADKFTAQTGIKVKISPTDENQFVQQITSAAAAG